MMYLYPVKRLYLLYMLAFTLFLHNCNNYSLISKEDGQAHNRPTSVAHGPQPSSFNQQKEVTLTPYAQQPCNPLLVATKGATEKATQPKNEPSDYQLEFILPGKAAPKPSQTTSNNTTTQPRLPNNVLPTDDTTEKKGTRKQLSLLHPALIHFYFMEDLVRKPMCPVEEIIQERSEAHALLKESVALKIAAEKDPTKFKKAISQLLIAAQSLYVAHTAMYHLGGICEKKGDIDVAVKWYVLAFQNYLFLEPSKAYQSIFYNTLKRLADQGLEFAARILLIHTFKLDTPAEKIFSYTNLIHFYKNETAIPYLSQQEREAIINRIQIEIRILNFLFPTVNQAVEQAQSHIKQGVTYMSNGDYQQAETFFFTSYLFTGCMA